MTDRYAEGLERAAAECEAVASESSTGIGRTVASRCMQRIRALIPVAAPTAPARLDAYKTAQPQATTGEHMVNIEGAIPWLMINGDAICRLATPHPELSVLRNRIDAAVAKAPPRLEERVRKIADDVWQVGKDLGGEQGRQLKIAASSLHEVFAAPQVDEADEKIVDDIVARNMPGGTTKRLLARSEEQVRAEERERERIVSWLRGDYKYNRNAQGFADAIEAGEHERPNGPPAGVVVGPAPVDTPRTDCLYGDCSKPSAAPWMHQLGCPAGAGPAPVDDTAARLAAAEARVRVLELAMQEIAYRADGWSSVGSCAVLRDIARAALAKEEGT